MHRKTLITAAFAFGFAFPSVSIAGPSISTQTAPGANFSAYKTYTWVQAQAQAGGNPIIQQEILADIDSALAQKGYQKAASGGDLSMILTLGAQDKTDIESYGRFGFQTSVWQYTQGQLSLDAFDSKTKQAVWHGQATETIDPNKPNQAKIDAGVQKLMNKFPATAAAAPAQP